MKKWEKLACVSYICFFTGMAVAEIGQPRAASEPITISTAISVFWFMALPAMLGYMAGRKDEMAANTRNKPTGEAGSA